MRYLTIFSSLLITLLFSCNTTPSSEPTNSTEAKPTVVDHKNENEFVAMVEKAHKRADFLGKTSIQFDIVLSFGGSERLNGTITTTTNSEKGIIRYKDGRKIYFDKDKVYHSPSMESSPGIRFGAYTWPYFFLFPYKLSDPGTHWNAYENTALNDVNYLTQKLTFSPGTGDDPDDWYIAYADKEKHLIEVAAYIVTAGGSTQEEAEKDPHAIQYKNYTLVDGIPIAQNWVFWGWTTEKGLTEQLGNASLSNIKFVETSDDTYKAPDDFKVM